MITTIKARNKRKLNYYVKLFKKLNYNVLLFNDYNAILQTELNTIKIINIKKEF